MIANGVSAFFHGHDYQAESSIVPITAIPARRSNVEALPGACASITCRLLNVFGSRGLRSAGSSEKPHLFSGSYFGLI
jgi:hypothetical protein